MNENVIALKSGIVYTVSSFLLAGISFFTTPIFTRMLSAEEYGAFNNFTSWLGILAIITTMRLSACFISARYQYKDTFDKFVFSIMTLSLFATGIWTIIFNIFSSYFVRLFDMRILYVNMMMLYIMFYEIVTIFWGQEQYSFRYKNSALISVCVAVMTTVLSVILVIMSRQRLTGRIIGYTLPAIVIGIGIYCVSGIKCREISLEHWKYAVPICLPYIPHLLSLTLLNSMDRIMITKICGERDTALYSLAYTCGSIVTILMSALNSAFGPWLGRKLNAKSFDEIKSFSYFYIIGFMYLVVGVILLAPEVLLVLGGPEYREAIRVVPPIMIGCAFQLIYSMHVNLEQFYRKTIGMALASALAAGVNYMLNLWLIPLWGYSAAAYTTLVSYFLLAILHIILVRLINVGKVYNNFFMLLVLFLGVAVTFIFNLLNQFDKARYFVLMLYVVLSACFVVAKKKYLWRLLLEAKK